MTKLIEDDLRATFVSIADVLIPAFGSLPTASGAGVGGPVLDRILSLRDDIRDTFFRGLRTVAGKPPEAAARELNEQDPTALATIGLVASAAYYMDPRVKQLIGYPGQARYEIDPAAQPDYLLDNILQPVINRGPIYRPTPR